MTDRMRWLVVGFSIVVLMFGGAAWADDDDDDDDDGLPVSRTVVVKCDKGHGILLLALACAI